MSSAYRGPRHLLASKYAAPSSKTLLSVPPFDETADNVVIAKDQSAAIKAERPDNGGIQLAKVQSEILEAGIKQQSSQFERAVNHAVTNTRVLLTMIRGSINKESRTAKADLMAVSKLWNELEQLFEAAKRAQISLPISLEKQKENRHLYHGSMVSGIIKDTQEEADQQHRKISMQRSAIVEQQELKERASRMVLELGLLRTELTKSAQDVANYRTQAMEALKVVGALKGEIHILTATKANLESENKSLVEALNDLQEKVKHAEQKITDHYEKEIRRIAEQFRKASQKHSSLESSNKSLRLSDDTLKKDYDRLKAEIKIQQAKYANQTKEYGILYRNNIELNSKIGTLEEELKINQQHANDLKERLVSFNGVMTANEQLTMSKAELEQELQGLMGKLAEISHFTTEVSQMSGSGGKEIEADKGEKTKLKMEFEKWTELNEITKQTADKVQSVARKLRGAQREIEGLETNNDELLGQLAESKKAVQCLDILKSENAKLRSAVEQLQHKAPDAQIHQSALEAVRREKYEVEHKYRKLHAEIEEWEDFATQTYDEYLKLLLIAKQSDTWYSAYLEMAQKNQELKDKLQDGETETNGSGRAVGDSDVVYWKEKYEALVDQF
ncbi:hypothetical protein CC78DRAFT_241580 [Lojkania enalia]|uniref:Uncharacterized protein n=1 Tax=Lojkania enalia TaxID=147567 RepID=A0A9P4TQX3_9PLEO|nr:hypothetical protein CC78DRAFT_241580 [Didymosphaeria enalia]